MTESNSSLPPAEIKTTSPVKQKQGKNRFSLFLSILTLLLLCVVSFFFWQAQNIQSLKIQQLLNSTKGGDQKLKSLQQDIQRQIRSANDLNEKQQVLLNSLAQESYFHTQKLSDLGARSRNDWLLAEAEYLMHLANQRVTFEQDIKSAEAMLTSADKVIAEINDPGLSEIRQALATEIISLQQTSHLDYEGLYLKLDAIIKSLDNLQQSAFLREKKVENAVIEIEATNEETNQFLIVWNSIWQDLKQAVSIRRLDAPVEPLLTPEQDYYLKQNLRLMLEQASLALIDKNTAIYQASINKTLAWLNRYFIEDDQQIEQLKSTLSSMASLNIEQTLPDISKSLRLTKIKIERFYKNHSISKHSTPDSESEAAKLDIKGNKEGSAL